MMNEQAEYPFNACCLPCCLSLSICTFPWLSWWNREGVTVWVHFGFHVTGSSKVLLPFVYGPWEMPAPVWSCTSGPGKLHFWSSSTNSAVALRSPRGLVRRAKLVNSQPLCSGRSRLARGDLTVYKLYNLNQGRVRFTAEQEVAVGTTRPVPTVWGTVEQRPQKSKGSSQVWVQDSSSPWTKSGSQSSCGESTLAACLWGRLETEVMLGLFYWVWNPASSETWHSLCS